MHSLTRSAFVVLTSFAAMAASLSAQTAKPAAPTLPAAPAIVGQWNGSAKGDSGEMNIEVIVEQKAGKLTGSVGTAHGTWAITSATEKDGVWVIEFSRGADNGSGKMSGKIRDGVYAGDWDNAPMAVGTFETAKKRS